MGIKGLANLIYENCKKGVKEEKISNYFSRVIAMDGNMSLYQFLIAIRGTGMDLANEEGQITSHIQGILHRTTKMLELGMKPVYVFDGKPPELKQKELLKRKQKVKDAEDEMDDADAVRQLQLAKRTIRVTKEQIDDVKILLKLMGVPVIQAPGEAEAQCCELVKNNVAYAVGTEDMDALTFGTPILLRHLHFSESRKEPIQEFRLEQILSEMNITMDQFIDICILCGCDYSETIRGIGPKKALQLIKTHQNLEGLLKNWKKNLPENFPYEEVRMLFKKPNVIPASEVKLVWSDVDEENLIDFLVNQKQFELGKVKRIIERLKVAKQKRGQKKLDDFFKKK